MEDAELAEIRRLQMQRREQAGSVLSMGKKGASYDSSDLYAAENGDSYLNSIPLNEDEAEQVDQAMASRKKFLGSFSAPQHLMDDTRTEKDDVDPFAATRRKTVGERESEYAARWRKRKLSPEKMDPFAKGGGAKTEGGGGGRSYKEVMQELHLEKERAEVLKKIEEKTKREREEAEQRQRKLKRVSPPSTPTRRDPRTGKKEKRDAEGAWGCTLVVSKKGEKLVELHLDPKNGDYVAGRAPDADIRLEHESCSKYHARFKFDTGNILLVDQDSTNGTRVNEQELKPQEARLLRDDDVIQFGCSTRDYRVKMD